jgi:TonB family protein
MKKSINILLLAVALLAVSACSSKSAKEEADKAAALAGIKKPADAALTPEERRLQAQKKREALAEKKTLAWEERVKTPTYKDQDGQLVYNKAEQDPTFNGGERALNLYFRDNVKFPEDAEKEGLDGTVYVDFVVSANGSVREVTATNIPGETPDQRFVDEAVRVVKAMPNWIPGRQHGKAVDVSFSVPVTFEIAG